jgi:hypothetical protein
LLDLLLQLAAHALVLKRLRVILQLGCGKQEDGLKTMFQLLQASKLVSCKAGLHMSGSNNNKHNRHARVRWHLRS